MLIIDRSASRSRFTVASAIGLACLLGCGSDPPIQSPDREVCLMLPLPDGTRYCIDVFEASRRDATTTSAGTDNASGPRSLKDRIPWADITWEAARLACEGKGKRLCESEEWIFACAYSASGTPKKYAYGDALDESGMKCNTKGTAADPSGKRESCKSGSGTYDQSGNVWEWTGNAASVARARGGGWASDRVHECRSDAMDAFPPAQASHQVGFRCCRTQAR